MSDARPPVPEISEPLTWKQICERYPDEWVALVEIGWVNDRDFDFTTARVIGHGKKRRDPFDQARARSIHYTSMGFFFTGRARTTLAPLLFP